MITFDINEHKIQFKHIVVHQVLCNNPVKLLTGIFRSTLDCSGTINEEYWLLKSLVLLILDLYLNLYIIIISDGTK
jgi:hypothetical protein